MASATSIGLSGLTVQQRLMDLVGQNITNANTPGYHRQIADLGMRTTGLEVGTGVEILQVRRLVDQNLESGLLRHYADLGNLTSQLQSLQQVQASFDLGDGSIQDLLGKFFDRADQLAAQPDDMTQRRQLLDAATNLANRFNSVSNELQSVHQGVDNQLTLQVNQVNDLAKRIADLNASIQINAIHKTNINDLSDQRDQLIRQLSDLIDVRTVDQEYGVTNVMAAGVPLVLGNQVLKLEIVTDSTNKKSITAAGLNIPLSLGGGQIAGTLEVRNEALGQVRDRLDTLAQAFIQAVDSTHATGLALGGPFRTLYGQRGVQNLSAPLAQAGLALPVQAGTLSISVTDLATGQRRTQQVAIDPATQNLQDVANAINGVGNLQAVIDNQNQSLVIVAQPGFAFDFAGRLPTQAAPVVQAGTASLGLGGAYTGPGNDVYTFRAVGTGTVGVDPNLTLEARDSAGSLIASWNIGQGYEAGTELAPVNGIKVRVGAGTVVTGDTFRAPAVANADTAGILTALGLNTMFGNSDLGTMAIRSDLLANPASLAASLTGQPANGGNLQKLAGLRDQLLLGNGTQTLEQFFAGTAADVGSRVQDVEQRHTAQETFGQRLEAEQQSMSGVDPNEELVRLLQFQKAYQFNARYLASINDTFDELLRLA